MKQIIFSIIVMLCLAWSVIGQDNPTAVLVDKLRVLDCDRLRSRLDAYFEGLKDDPGSYGLIVTFGPFDQKHGVALQQALFEAHAKASDVDLKRLQFLRAQSDENISTQLWRVPAGAPEPGIPRVDMSQTIPSTLKPFLMGVRTKMVTKICLDVDDTRVFATFLKANPTARGNIVVRDVSVDLALSKARKTLSDFSQKYGIASSRLRPFGERLTKPPSEDEAVLEYWYLP